MWHLSLHAIYTCLLVLRGLRVVCAQDFAVPVGWQNTNSPLSRADRRQLALGAAQELQANIAPGLGVPSEYGTASTAGNVVIVMAAQDRLNGSTTFEAQVRSTLEIFEQNSGGAVYYASTDYVLDKAYFGLAEINAYLAYNDGARLAAAVDLWNLVHTAFITSDAAQSGNFPRAINTTCGASLGGAVFVHLPPAIETGVMSNALSPWIALSSHLAELTGNSTYLDAAELSIQFMQTHMLNLGNTTSIVAAEFNVADCTPSIGVSTTWDVGPYVEGLSIVANITRDSTHVQALADIIPQIVAVSEWHNSQGVIFENNRDFRKGTVIRGLLEARHRNPTNAAMVNLIDSYINVQLNAVLANARNEGSDDYTTSWLGDGKSGFAASGSVEALDVLNAGFDIASGSGDDSRNVPAPSATPSPSPGASHVPVGAIVGATVGGFVLVAGLLLGFYLCLRQRKRVRDATFRENKLGVQQTVPIPFVSTTPRPRYNHAAKGSRAYLLEAGGGSDYSLSSSGAASTSEPMAEAPNAPTLLHLANRLDSLLDVLARRGVVEDTPAHAPPQYEARAGRGA